MDIDQVRKVAGLARLDLPAADLAVLAQQLTAILGYVDQLTGAGHRRMWSRWPTRCRSRTCSARTSCGRRCRSDEALRNAPARSGDFFAVPAVLDPRTIRATSPVHHKDTKHTK